MQMTQELIDLDLRSSILQGKIITYYLLPITYYLDSILNPEKSELIISTGFWEICEMALGRGRWVLLLNTAISCNKNVIKAACISLSSIVPLFIYMDI